jgi:hypothetical protein
MRLITCRGSRLNLAAEAKKGNRVKELGDKSLASSDATRQRFQTPNSDLNANLSRGGEEFDSARIIALHDESVDVADRFGDCDMEIGDAEEPPIAKPGQNPAVGESGPFARSWPCRAACKAAQAGSPRRSGRRTPGCCGSSSAHNGPSRRSRPFVADHELRRAAQESEQVHVCADPAAICSLGRASPVEGTAASIVSPAKSTETSSPAAWLCRILGAAGA